jgi:hypothetical protein
VCGIRPIVNSDHSFALKGAARFPNLQSQGPPAFVESTKEHQLIGRKSGHLSTARSQGPDLSPDNEFGEMRLCVSAHVDELHQVIFTCSEALAGQPASKQFVSQPDPIGV